MVLVRGTPAGSRGSWCDGQRALRPGAWRACLQAAAPRQRPFLSAGGSRLPSKTTALQDDCIADNLIFKMVNPTDTSLFFRPARSPPASFAFLVRDRMLMCASRRMGRPQGEAGEVYISDDPVDAKIIKGFRLNHLNMRDAGSGKVAPRRHNTHDSVPRSRLPAELAHQTLNPTP